MATARTRTGAPRTGRLAMLGIVAMLAVLPGCADSLMRRRLAGDKGIAKPITAAEIGDDRPFLARLIRPKAPKMSTPDTDTTLVLGSNGWAPPRVERDAESERAFEAAQAAEKQGKLGQAEAAYAKLARTKKGTSWGERAQFALAEIQYKQGKLVAANENYEKLFGDYPGTRFVEEAVEREYAIGRIWLAETDPKTDPGFATRMRDRLTGRLPTVDSRGHALSALEHVRHHDVDGPLADDAVMTIARHHEANENYEEAAIHYDQLIASFPKSKLVQPAQVASVDAKMKAYLGPDYDGTGLEQARETLKQSMEQFPEQLASHSDEMYKKLDHINEQDAERTYKIGEHYLWTGHINSAEYYFGEIPVRWPKSGWSKKAKVQLAKIAKMPRQEAKASKIMTTPGGTDPLTGNGGGSGYGMQSGPSGMGNYGGANGATGP